MVFHGCQQVFEIKPWILKMTVRVCKTTSSSQCHSVAHKPGETLGRWTGAAGAYHLVSAGSSLDNRGG